MCVIWFTLLVCGMFRFVRNVHAYVLPSFLHSFLTHFLMCHAQIDVALAAVIQNGLALEYFLPIFHDRCSRHNSGIHSTAKNTDTNSTIDDNEDNSKNNEEDNNNDDTTSNGEEKKSDTETDSNQLYKEVIITAGK